ncbi:MAG: hypothetical protein VX899_02955 [Myxococcota bacterium]|nr:hypothetical protein [Myxococcota bacterium]
MQATVELPGRKGVVAVPVGLSLWVGQAPVTDARVVFFEQPQRRSGPAWVDGRVSMDSQSWWCIAHGIEEEFEWQGQLWIRHRALLWDEDRDRVVGGYYWCVQVQSLG